jgi:uncharacterized protein (DUF2141 family)
MARLTAAGCGAALCSLWACAGAGSAPPRAAAPALAAPAPAHAGGTALSLDVELIDLRNDRGLVRVSVFRQPAGFPEQPERAFARGQAPIRGGRSLLHFGPVPPGAIAVAAHHDEDEDLQMATGFMGMPTEGYGFSRDATGTFGPPSFDAASLELVAGQTTRVRIRMRY